MAQVLRQITPVCDERLLVGATDADDAAVYALPQGGTLILTADYLTPLHDDPHTWGTIVAANCLSDVYAMGGRPLVALNLAGWPADKAPADMLAQVLQGGIDKAAEAHVAIAGGHTIEAPEPFYGLAVVGEAKPDRITRKSGALPGDALVLTKPLGVGIIVTAAMADMADPAHLAAAVASMQRLNRRPAEAMVRAGAHAATDITGFGLAGHACEMARASGVELRFEWADVPVLDGALKYAADWCLGKGLLCNRRHFAQWVVSDALTAEQSAVAFDPQTSGGLLVALPRADAGSLVADLAAGGEPAWVIGEVAESETDEGRVVIA